MNPNNENDLEKLYNTFDNSNNSPYMKQSELDLESDKTATQQLQVVQQPTVQEQPVKQVEENVTNPCRKCGQPVPINARCCLYCGELNYNNEKNTSVKKIFKKGEKIRDKKQLQEVNPNITTNTGLNNNESTKKKAFTFKLFRLIKTIITICILVLIIVNYKNIYNKFNELRYKYYIHQVDRIIDKLEADLPNMNCYSLGGNVYYKVDTSLDGDYKTTFSLFTLNYYKGYVKVEKVDSEYKYYLYITDGKYGIENVLYSDGVKVDDFKEIKNIDIPVDGTICKKLLAN